MRNGETPIWAFAVPVTKQANPFHSLALTYPPTKKKKKPCIHLSGRLLMSLLYQVCEIELAMTFSPLFAIMRWYLAQTCCCFSLRRLGWNRNTRGQKEPHFTDLRFHEHEVGAPTFQLVHWHASGPTQEKKNPTWCGISRTNLPKHTYLWRWNANQLDLCPSHIGCHPCLLVLPRHLVR